MNSFPNAKLNLGLNITSRRSDGYHNLETIFYPVPLADALEVVESTEPSQQIRLHTYGRTVDGTPEQNLVVKAYNLLHQLYKLPPVEVHLYKHIPSGAGLGGGSSDAAFMLKLLNTKFALGLSDEKLEELAATLGADCAFFIRNRPTFATGIGNIFSPLSVDLSGFGLLIVRPDVFVSTREAFSRIHPAEPAYDLRQTISRPIEEWRHYLTNDFEQSVFPQYPLLGDIKSELYRQGACYASMSGSGSSLFGLFQPGVPIPAIPADFTFSCVL